MSAGLVAVLGGIYAAVAWIVVSDPSRSRELPARLTNVLSLCVIIIVSVPFVLLCSVWISVVSTESPRMPGDAKAYAMTYVPWGIFVCSALITASIVPKARLYGRRLVLLAWTILGASIVLAVFAVAYHSKLR